MKLFNLKTNTTTSNIDSTFTTTLVIPRNQPMQVAVGYGAFGFSAELGGKVIVEGSSFNMYKDMYFSLPEKRTTFLLYPNEGHSFHTQNSFLRMFVCHQDSKRGLTHTLHPRLNRTYIHGTSLRGTNRYRTRKIRV